MNLFEHTHQTIELKENESQITDIVKRESSKRLL